MRRAPALPMVAPWTLRVLGFIIGDASELYDGVCDVVRWTLLLVIGLVHRKRDVVLPVMGLDLP